MASNWRPERVLDRQQRIDTALDESRYGLIGIITARDDTDYRGLSQDLRAMSDGDGPVPGRPGVHEYYGDDGQGGEWRIRLAKQQ